jgi:hypothetical protein
MNPQIPVSFLARANDQGDWRTMVSRRKIMLHALQLSPLRKAGKNYAAWRWELAHSDAKIRSIARQLVSFSQ